MFKHTGTRGYPKMLQQMQQMQQMFKHTGTRGYPTSDYGFRKGLVV